jgi:hypothetical protein
MFEKTKFELSLVLAQVKMDKTKNAARIQCTICLEDFQVSSPLKKKCQESGSVETVSGCLDLRTLKEI